MLLMESYNTTNNNDFREVVLPNLILEIGITTSNTKQINQTIIQYNKTNNRTTYNNNSKRNQGVSNYNNKPTNLIFILLCYFIEVVSITTPSC